MQTSCFMGKPTSDPKTRVWLINYNVPDPVYIFADLFHRYVHALFIFPFRWLYFLSCSLEFGKWHKVLFLMLAWYHNGISYNIMQQLHGSFPSMGCHFISCPHPLLFLHKADANVIITLTALRFTRSTDQDEYSSVRNMVTVIYLCVYTAHTQL